MTRREHPSDCVGNGPGSPDARAPGLTGLTRRRFAALAAAATAAAGAPACGGAEVDAFRRLSAALTGFPAESLDVRFARSLLQALGSSGHHAATSALVRGEEVADRAALEADIVSAWYSGLLPGEAEPTVAALRDALVWKALRFASPPGTCTTGGSWDEPPPGEKR